MFERLDYPFSFFFCFLKRVDLKKFKKYSSVFGEKKVFSFAAERDAYENLKLKFQFQFLSR